MVQEKDKTSGASRFAMLFLSGLLVPALTVFCWIEAIDFDPYHTIFTRGNEPPPPAIMLKVAGGVIMLLGAILFVQTIRTGAQRLSCKLEIVALAWLGLSLMAMGPAWILAGAQAEEIYAEGKSHEAPQKQSEGRARAMDLSLFGSRGVAI